MVAKHRRISSSIQEFSFVFIKAEKSYSRSNGNVKTAILYRPIGDFV